MAKNGVLLVVWRIREEMTDKPLKRSGTKYICECLCQCRETRLIAYNGKIIECCPHKPPMIVNLDGTKEEMEING